MIPSDGYWTQGLRAVVPCLGLFGLLGISTELRSEDNFSRWAVRPANSGQRPLMSDEEASFDAIRSRQFALPNTLPEQAGSNAASPLRSIEPWSIEKTAYQSQYPLSKDSADLLPDENKLGLNSHNDLGLPTDELGEPDALFEDAEDRPWIVWQKTTASATWIAPKKENGLGVTSFDVRGSIEFPDFQALWFVPRAAAHLIDGPQVTDLPGQLYDFSFEAVAMIPATEQVFFQLAIAPSFFSDLQNTSNGAFRLPGRLLGFWKYSETLMFNAGVFYLDRDDVKWLPVAGIVWNYSDDLKLELMAPRPRIAWRFSHADCDEHWAYVVGEFGGGTWAVQRASGVNDVATLQDYKLMLGVERKWDTVKSWWVEAGYVFNRRVEYTSGIGDSDLSSSGVARVGMSF